jgi:membrane-associated protein
MLEYLENMDLHISSIINHHGYWFYGIIGMVIFLECGTFIKSFIPGDTILFVLGSFMAKGELSPLILFITLFFATILGDYFAYYSAKYAMLLSKNWHKKFLSVDKLESTKNYFEEKGRYGILFARLVPYMRGMAPFVAGAVQMNILRFTIFNISGAILWVILYVMLGFFFGHLPMVQENLGLLVIVLIILGVIPILRVLISKKVEH